jgi:hypothetical protein
MTKATGKEIRMSSIAVELIKRDLTWKVVYE